MKRIPPLLLAPGVAFLLLGIMFGLFLNPTERPTAVLAMPDDHPTHYTPNALLPTTNRDYILPGTQPNQVHSEILAPLNCTYCHGDGYSQQTGQDPETETWNAWSGSMMAQAGRDPVFYAALDIANADAAGSGELCLRCHMPRGWLNGRAASATTAAMTDDDREGVQCEVCHRMVDPFYSNENPPRDLEVMADITRTVTAPGNGTYIVDPLDHRRGPLLITEILSGTDPHYVLGYSTTLQSPYHTEALFCGTCHNIDNPLLSWNEASQSYQLNDLNAPADTADLFPIERTYSEWLLSAYNTTPGGIYAPEFGGNRDFVSTCQDCHMRAVTGVGGLTGFGFIQPNRDNYPFHDLTGANTWVPQIIPLHPVFSSTFDNSQTGIDRQNALDDGVLRARYMLQNAAELNAVLQDDQLLVTVFNQSGHKLPTGYVEGRRMWLQVEGYDINNTLVYTSGWYNVATGDLTQDSDLKLYESNQGLTADWAATLGLPEGKSFHFMLNNGIVSDNRIPPRGYDFADYAAAGAAPYTNWQPDAARYADGQYWDTTAYALPAGVVSGTVRLVHQVASKEYIEFLRDNNPNAGNDNGQILYDLWQEVQRSKPEVMAEVSFAPSTVLAIGKRGPTAVALGDPITYTLTLTNNDTVTATNLVVLDTLPSTAHYLSSSDGGILSRDTVRWEIPSLLAGESLSLQLVVTATETVTNSDYVVAADEGKIGYGRPAVTTAVLRPALAIGKSGPAQATAANPFAYTLTITNSDSLTATGIVVADTLPAGATYVSSSDGGTLNAGVVSWQIPSLAPGAVKTVTLVVSADSSVTNAVYEVTAVGRATGTGTHPVTTLISGYAIYLPIGLKQ